MDRAQSQLARDKKLGVLRVALSHIAIRVVVAKRHGGCVCAALRDRRARHRREDAVPIVTIQLVGSTLIANDHIKLWLQAG